MTLFFLVVGLEAKRQLDLGELRDRRRLAVPGRWRRCAGSPFRRRSTWPGTPAVRRAWLGRGDLDRHRLCARRPSGLLAPRSATRMRVFLLSLAVVDDLAGLRRASRSPTRSHVSVAGAGRRGRPVRRCCSRCAGCRCARRALAIGLGIGIWLAMFESGIDPVISGLAIGLATSAYPPSREEVAQAVELTRTFREQPTPELARAAQRGVGSSISPNERLQYELHPWTSYLIVPLFALANAGVHLSGGLLSAAFSSPITLGILTGYVVGKPIGRRHRLVARIAPAAARTACAGQPAGAARRRARSPAIGFTVSLLISSLAFRGRLLRGGEDRHAVHADRRAGAVVAGAEADPRACPAELARTPDRRPPPRTSSTSPPMSTPSATTPAAPRTRR